MAWAEREYGLRSWLTADRATGRGYLQRWLSPVRWGDQRSVSANRSSATLSRLCRGRGYAGRPAAGPGPRHKCRKPPRHGHRTRRRSRTALCRGARPVARPCAAAGSTSRPRTAAMSPADAGRGSVRGTSMVSMRSIGLASSRSCRTAHLQNDATAARLRLRVDGACPAISPRNARTGDADRSSMSPSWQPANAIRSPR
jgi:hypothetical protein